jgi:hypothetical protein
MRGFLPSSAYFVGYYEWCFLLRHFALVSWSVCLCELCIVKVM